MPTCPSLSGWLFGTSACVLFQPQEGLYACVECSCAGSIANLGKPAMEGLLYAPSSAIQRSGSARHILLATRRRTTTDKSALHPAPRLQLSPLAHSLYTPVAGWSLMGQTPLFQFFYVLEIRAY